MGVVVAAIVVDVDVFVVVVVVLICSTMYIDPLPPPPKGQQCSSSISSAWFRSIVMGVGFVRGRRCCPGEWGCGVVRGQGGGQCML